MSDLPIQIVDDDNNPTGQASKEEAWKKGLIHRTVRIIIIDSAGRLLVQKRSQQKGLFPGRWDNSVAGHVDAEESYEQAALREMAEELGLHNIELEKVGDYYVEVTHEWRVMRRFTRTYKAVLSYPLPAFQLPRDEVERVKWMTIADVKKLIADHPDKVTDGLEQVVARYL